MKIIIRADSSPFIGTGHVVRCLTLAEYLRNEGADVSFVCRDHENNLIAWIEREKRIKVHVLPADRIWNFGKGLPLSEWDWLGTDIHIDAAQTISVLKEIRDPDWIVVDHYSLDYRWEKQIRPYVRKIMVVDDLANRRHECDLLTDPNLSEDPRGRYGEIVTDQCKVLAGPEFVIMRPEFRIVKEKTRIRDGRVNRILVFFGSDPTNETEKALRAIRRFTPKIAIDVVISLLNPFRYEIESFAAGLPNCSCHVQTSSMAELMSLADLSIGAGGTTMWERCSLGLPSIVIAVAKNQEGPSLAMASAASILYLGRSREVTVDALTEHVSGLIRDPGLLVRMSSLGQSLVDGRGCERIAKYLISDAVKVRAGTRGAGTADKPTYQLEMENG